MKYNFPVIQKIDDVLPHIEGSSEFVVAEKKGYTVINYVVQTNDTFPSMEIAGGSAKMRSERMLTNAMRRECRGLIFDTTGRLISRPYHKFFNIGEREETMPNKIDLSGVVVFEKLDGSMIRPFYVDGVLRLGTKMGVTDIAVEAENWLKSQSNSRELIKELELFVNADMTPIFEWVSPSNKIVLRYDDSDLVMTALRFNTTGTYLPIPKVSLFTSAKSYTAPNDIMEYIKDTREATGIEGFVFRSSEGHMHKLKCDEYVRIHKVKDDINNDKNILALIINNELDDILPIIDEEDRRKVREYEVEFWKTYHLKVKRLEEAAIKEKNLCDGDKKRFALERSKEYNSNDKSIIFRFFDGADVEEEIMNRVEASTSRNVKYDEMITWLSA